VLPSDIGLPFIEDRVHLIREPLIELPRIPPSTRRRDPPVGPSFHQTAAFSWTLCTKPELIRSAHSVSAACQVLLVERTAAATCGRVRLAIRRA